MKKQRSYIRMDDLNTEQRKELNSIIKKTVQDFNNQIAVESQPDQEAE